MKKAGKAVTGLLMLIMAGMPVSFAEDISPNFAQKDLSFTAQPQLDLGKYSMKTGFQGIRTEDGLVSLVSDTCSDPGDKEGSFRCLKTFSNGNKVQITTDQEYHGEDFKRQTVIAEFNSNNLIQGRQTVRQKISYKFVNNERKMRAEFFDVVSRPKNGKITREVIIYQYNTATGDLQNVSWTSYEQIGDSAFAMITRHVALTYDEDGKPLMGRAEKWRNEVPVEKLFSWNRVLDGNRTLDMNSWDTWKNQIFKISPRQIF